MLIQFSVNSFLSFRDEVILSLSTNKDDSHNENLLSYKKWKNITEYSDSW